MGALLSAREVDDIKTMTSLDTSVVLASLSATATAAPPSPPSRLPPSALSAPRNSPPSKRKLDTEDELARKRLQVDLHSSPEYTAARGGSKSIPQEQEDHESENRYHESYDSPACKRLQAEASLLPNQLIASDLPKSSPKEREHPELDNRYLESEERPPDISPQATRAPLSRQNLKLLQQEVATSEEMDNESTSSARKRRAPSRQASNSDLVSGTSGRTRESIPSHSFYRYHTLDHANVQIWAEPPSTALQTQLDIIINANVDDERTREISVIAKQKSTRFSKLLRGSHREDDLVELVYEALLALHEYEMFTCPRKADWNLDLKPTIQQQQYWDFEKLNQQTPGNATEPSGKPQQTIRPFPSPETSQSDMPPPPAPQSATVAQNRVVQHGAVKTPRPDFTIGFAHSKITQMLVERGMSALKASEFLKVLQRKQKLCSDPTQHFLEVRFPFLVIEGKAYATGKTLFEAENQAAVSGSSMLNIQQQLMAMTALVPHNDDKNVASTAPIAFSICTQGPILELWAHYIVTDGGITEYHMNLIAACHACLQHDLAVFLSKTDRLLTWYKNDYLEVIVDRLYSIATCIAR